MHFIFTKLQNIKNNLPSNMSPIILTIPYFSSNLAPSQHNTQTPSPPSSPQTPHAVPDTPAHTPDTQPLQDNTSNINTPSYTQCQTYPHIYHSLISISTHINIYDCNNNYIFSYHRYVRCNGFCVSMIRCSCGRSIRFSLIVFGGCIGCRCSVSSWGTRTVRISRVWR